MVMPRVANNLPDKFQTVLLAQQINLPISATGDVLINGNAVLPIIASKFKITAIVVWNPLVNGVSGSVSAAALGVFTAAAAGGTTVAANQSLTPTQTVGTTSAQDLTITNAATTTFAGPTALFVNVGTAVTSATVNISVYGQVLQP